MCGICGIFDLNGRPVDEALLSGMISEMAHRGPDGEGRFVSGGIGLGHRRLSIIDIGGGAQPITNETGGINVVFNGEIYNYIELREDLKRSGHAFRTRSDTEVIVHGYEEWGTACLDRFNGIFAFALWDENLKRLFLARDHLGVKPLYYAAFDGRLIFASEIKPLLKDPGCKREVDIKALGELFTFRYVPSPKTLFSGIKKLKPGHMMLASSSGFEVRRHWNWRPVVNGARKEADLVEEYRGLVEDSIRLQMRSDVPVGVFLSSGIDSCSILAIASGLSGRPLNTFTIGFEGGEKTNETGDARRMAESFGAEHTEMIVGPGDYRGYYERYLRDIEEPLGNETAAAFYFVSLIASRKVKVALTGQGADEPWAGYHRHLGVKLSGLYSRLPRFLTGDILMRAAAMVPRNERLKRGVLSLAEPDLLTRFTRIYSFFSPAMKNELFKDWVKEEIDCEGLEARESLRALQSDVKRLDPLTQILYMDTRSNLPDDLLMVADKTAMANSMEARVPFLDRRIVEFIETVPPHLKLRRFRGKYLHKKALEKWLPKRLVHSRKKGFENPIEEWLRAELLSYVNECLLSGDSAVNRYFNGGCIRRIIKDHQERKEDHLRHIYLLISFELWHRQFIGR